MLLLEMFIGMGIIQETRFFTFPGEDVKGFQCFWVLNMDTEFLQYFQRGRMYFADICIAQHPESAVKEAADAAGTIDILINNTGIDKSQYFVDTDEALWDLIINVNYKSFLIASHVCIPIMMEQKSGNIVSLGSDAGRIGNPGEVLYCGTKGAIMSSSKALAKELARFNIRVNAVSPGPVQTALWDSLHSGEKGKRVTEAVTRAIPLRRLGTPEDVADVVAFFVSDDARYLTGQVLSIDGGLTMIS